MRTGVHIEEFNFTQRHLFLASTERFAVRCGQFNIGEALLGLLRPGPKVSITSWSQICLDRGNFLFWHMRRSRSFLDVQFCAIGHVTVLCGPTISTLDFFKNARSAASTIGRWLKQRFMRGRRCLAGSDFWYGSLFE